MLSWCWESTHKGRETELQRGQARKGRESRRRKLCEAVTRDTRGACVVLGRGERRGHGARDRREKINGWRNVVKKNVIASVKNIACLPIDFTKMGKSAISGAPGWRSEGL